MKRVQFVLVSVSVPLYAADCFSVRYRILKTRNPRGVVTITRYDPVGLKDQKTEFMFLEPESQTRIYSLSPPFGYIPCWYLRRKSVRRIDT
jgi:hypothetical protein